MDDQQTDYLTGGLLDRWLADLLCDWQVSRSLSYSFTDWLANKLSYWIFRDLMDA